MPLDSNEKHQELLALGTKRRKAPVPEDCHPIGKYHKGAYESVYVSPYTKSARNVDAEVAVMLQDWASHDSLDRPEIDNDAATIGYTSTAQTNINLIALLKKHFGLDLSETFATNLFPFVKGGAMNTSIRTAPLDQATKDFAMPQIRIVSPKLLICLGVVVFNALRRSHGLKLAATVDECIRNPFLVEGTWYWCQSHTGQQGRNQRGVDRIADDWKHMADSYKNEFRCMP